MNISSHFVESDDLGVIHFTRFMPPNVSNEDLGIYFAGINGRVTTLDTFAAAFVVAEETKMAVDVVDRPGTGFSALPEISTLRYDYRKFGFVAIREAILEAQLQDELFRRAERIHVTGMSLGGYISLQYIEALNNRASSAKLIDSSGMRHPSNSINGFGRYLTYLGLESGATRIGKKPSLENKIKVEPKIIESFDEFIESLDLSQLPAPPDKEAMKLEIVESIRPIDGNGVVTLIDVMQRMVDKSKQFELRASRSGARVLTDKKSVDFINNALNKFDEDNSGQTVVSYGFMQDGMPWWHDLALSPEVLRAFINTPIGNLNRRLK